MLSYEGNQNWGEWLKKVDEEIKRCGQPLNTYFFATGCGLDSYSHSRTKLQKFVSKHPEFAFIEDHDALKKGSFIQPCMALKTKVSNIEEIKQKWKMLFDRKEKLVASCGCSIFISDGQEVRVCVLEPNIVFGWE